VGCSQTSAPCFASAKNWPAYSKQSPDTENLTLQVEKISVVLKHFQHLRSIFPGGIPFGILSQNELINQKKWRQL
jgi:hypothetical protein